MRDTQANSVPGADARGFSLIELLVAMVVTMIVTGAIYGLLASGQTAFRREPEVADRQQNIRIAMDLISRDIDNAGSGMPVVSQVFTASDAAGGVPVNAAGAPFLNGAGPMGVLGPAAMAARGAAPTGAAPDTSENSDILEILGSEEACPTFTLCGGPINGSAGGASTREFIPNTSCMMPGNPRQGLVLLTDNRYFAIQPAVPAGGACAGGGANQGANLGAALPRFNTPVAFTPAAGVLAFMNAARITRYMIANNPDPADPSPALWRSTTGLFSAAGAALGPPPAAQWQMVARGIEDLQVEYMNGNGLWMNNPGGVSNPPCVALPTCTAAELNQVVRQVRVTLSARSLAANLAGATNPGGGVAPAAIRGQLVSVVTPRSALMGLQSLGQLP